MTDRSILDNTTGTERIKAMLSDWKHMSGAEIYLILMLLIFGLSAITLLPVGAGYDEETHLLRVWQMSALTFVPNDNLGKGMPFPAVYWEMSYRRPFLVRPVEAGYLNQYKGLRVDAHDYIYGNLETRSVYSPPLLLPQAIVMRYLGRSGRWSALMVLYACRIVGLMSFMVLAWLAVRLIPFGKWLFAVLASSPVVILQAATVSADAISNGIALLFIGGSLALSYRKETDWKRWTAFALLFLILFWGKLNIVPLAILPFLLLKPSNFKMRFGYVSLVLVAITLLLLEVAGWALIAYSRLHTPPEGTDPIGQVRFMLGEPLRFSAILAGIIRAKAIDYLRDWIAIYGYNYWPVPVYVFFLYAAALLAALFQRTDSNEINPRTRAGLILVFIITYLATIVSLYVSFTPVGSQHVEAVQGRYFVTVMPLLFLGLVGLPWFRQIRIPAVLTILFGSLSLAIYLAGMYLVYYVPCGAQYYQAGLCYQPNYKNWAPNELYSPPVSDQMVLTQEIVAECSGMQELRLWIDSTEADPQHSTNFILKDVQGNREVFNTSVQNSELPAGSWYGLEFPVDWESNGKFYLLTISSADNKGPRVAYSLRAEYPAGKLYENGQPISKDLIFQTGCLAGWAALRAQN